MRWRVLSKLSFDSWRAPNTHSIPSINKQPRGHRQATATHNYTDVDLGLRGASDYLTLRDGGIHLILVRRKQIIFHVYMFYYFHFHPFQLGLLPILLISFQNKTQLCISECREEP